MPRARLASDFASPLLSTKKENDIKSYEHDTSGPEASAIYHSRARRQLGKTVRCDERIRASFAYSATFANVTQKDRSIFSDRAAAGLVSLFAASCLKFFA